MKFISFAVLAFGVATISAQFDAPACAQPCILQAVSKDIAGCNKVDIACLCGKEEFVNSISTCVTTNCKPEEVQSILRSAQKFCADAGGTLNTGSATTTGPTPTSTGNITTPTGNGTVTSGTPSETGAANNLVAGGMGILGAAVAALFLA